jgi:putative acetyltransferase
VRSVLIRPEEPADHVRVSDVHRRAFGEHGEDVVVPLLTDLRRSLATEQGLSLVACEDDEVIGHVLFTRNLLDAPPRLVDVQVLSPIAVHPDHQRHGVGAALIERGVAELDDRGVPAVFLEGDPGYYRRVGFVAAGELGFGRPSLRIPEPAFQVRLLRGHQPWMTGTLVYRQTFWDHDAVGLRES